MGVNSELKTELKYDEGTVMLDRQIPGRLSFLIKEQPSDSAGGRHMAELAEEALKNPIGAPHLSQVVKAGESVCILMSDITRAYQRMDQYLPVLVNELNRAGVMDGQITLLCALGAHDFQREEEKKLILGELYGRISFVEHDCRKTEDLVFLGISPGGTPVSLNRLAVECDRLIVTGAVGYHDMAGYGGGRKSLMPGIASYEGVAGNHLQVFEKRPGHGLHPGCRMGNLRGNPMHEDMMYAAELAAPDYLLNVVLDQDGQPYKAVAGHWKLAFDQAVLYCDEACSVAIEEKADVVIAGCGGYPKDRDLYQASKGFSTAAEAAREGGIILMIAACREGMGAELSARIITDYDRQEDREEQMRRAFAPEAYSGYLICQLAQRYQLLLVSDYSPAEELVKSGVKLFRRIEEALDAIYEKDGMADRLQRAEGELLTCVIPHAMSILPKGKG